MALSSIMVCTCKSTYRKANIRGTQVRKILSRWRWGRTSHRSTCKRQLCGHVLLTMYILPSHRYAWLLASTEHLLTRAKQGKGLPASPSPSRDTPDHCQTFRPAPGRDHVLDLKGQSFLAALTGNRRRTRMSSVVLLRSLSVQFLGQPSKA